MDDHERGLFDELIASIESGRAAKDYEQQVSQNALSENRTKPCPPEDD